MDERLPPPPPQSQLVSPMSAPASPYFALHPLLLPSPNPHLLLKPKTLTLSLSSSLASMPSSSSPPAPASDAWELVHPTVTVAAAAPIDGGLDDCAMFPPRLHEGLGLEGEAEEAATKEEKEEETDDDEEWLWGGGGAARRRGARGRPGQRPCSCTESADVPEGGQPYGRPQRRPLWLGRCCTCAGGTGGRGTSSSCSCRRRISG